MTQSPIKCQATPELEAARTAPDHGHSIIRKPGFKVKTSTPACPARGGRSTPRGGVAELRGGRGGRWRSARAPVLRGSASAEANAYREQTILEAKGQTARYNQIHEQYQKAPAVTRERMYLETMERVLGPMDKTIVDSNSASAPVPYIGLEPLQSRTAGSAK